VEIGVAVALEFGMEISGSCVLALAVGRNGAQRTLGAVAGLEVLQVLNLGPAELSKRGKELVLESRNTVRAA
jgi:hypothetical protein